MNSDLAVMEFFPEPLDRSQSDDLIEKIEAGFEVERLWALGG